MDGWMDEFADGHAHLVREMRYACIGERTNRDHESWMQCLFSSTL